MTRLLKLQWMTANRGLLSSHWRWLELAMVFETHLHSHIMCGILGLDWLCWYSLLCYPLQVLLAPAVGGLAEPLTPGGSGFSVRARVILFHFLFFLPFFLDHFFPSDSLEDRCYLLNMHTFEICSVFTGLMGAGSVWHRTWWNAEFGKRQGSRAP